MAQVKLSALFKKRRRYRIFSGLAFLVLVALLGQMVIISNPKKTEAGVSIGLDGNANNIIVAGSTNSNSYRNYVIDRDGYIYAMNNNNLLSNKLSTEIDFRYYSYLAEPISCRDYRSPESPAGEVVLPCKVDGADRNLIIDDALVLMEGEHTFQNITVRNSGQISQPFADAEAKLNRPMFSKGHWGAEFEGYISLEAPGSDTTTRCGWLHFLPSNYDGIGHALGAFGDETGGDLSVDDAVQIQVEDGNGVWQTVYRRSTNQTQWGSNIGTSFNSYYTNLSTNLNNTGLVCFNGTATTAKHFRVRYANYEGAASWSLYLTMMDTAPVGSNWVRYSQNYVNFGRLRSVAASDDASKYYRLNFKYFMAKSDTSYSLDFDNEYIKTAWKDNIDLVSAFTPGFGLYDETSNDQQTGLFRYIFGSNNRQGNRQADTPLGSTSVESIVQRRFVSAQHSGSGSNEKAYSLYSGAESSADNTARRVYSGLTLNIGNELKLEGGTNSNIKPFLDLDGVGYPGGLYQTDARYEYAFGSGPGRGIAPINKFSRGGGGWFAREGGSSDCGDRCSGGSPQIYGDGSEKITNNSAVMPVFIGSGGGASYDRILNSPTLLTGGSGGGALKINAKKISTTGRYSQDGAISANGTSGSADYARSYGTLIDYNHSFGSGGKVVLEVGEISAEFDSDRPLISVRGYQKPTRALDDSLCAKIAGGSGGYLTMVYTSSGQSYDQIKSALSADTICQNETTGYSSNGSGHGVVSLVKDDGSGGLGPGGVTVKKTLQPSKRGGVSNSTFNPYALMLGDEIRVDLAVANMSLGVQAVIVDEPLKTPSSASDKYICAPVPGTGQPVTPVQIDGAKVEWRYTPATSADTNKTFSYYCLVTAQ